MTDLFSIPLMKPQNKLLSKILSLWVVKNFLLLYFFVYILFNCKFRKKIKEIVQNKRNGILVYHNFYFGGFRNNTFD